MSLYVMFANLHFRLQFSNDVVIRVRPRTLERVEYDLRMRLWPF